MTRNIAWRQFPGTRMRRNRFSDFSRRLVREHEISANDFIYPMFIIEGTRQREPVTSMPGIERVSIDELKREVEELLTLGVPAIALFPKIDAGCHSAPTRRARLSPSETARR